MTDTGYARRELIEWFTGVAVRATEYWLIAWILLTLVIVVICVLIITQRRAWFKRFFAGCTAVTHVHLRLHRDAAHLHCHVTPNTERMPRTCIPQH